MENVSFLNCNTNFGYLFYINYQSKKQDIIMKNITLSGI